MRNLRLAALAVAVAITGSRALADGALSPGKPAGVREALRHGPNLLLIGGVTVAVVAGIVIATTTSGNSSCSTTACPVLTTPSTTS